MPSWATFGLDAGIVAILAVCRPPRGERFPWPGAAILAAVLCGALFVLTTDRALACFPRPTHLGGASGQRPRRRPRRRAAAEHRPLVRLGYAGVGQLGLGVPDMLLGVREKSIGYGQLSRCEPGPFRFGPGGDGFCDVLHFWSHHP